MINAALLCLTQPQWKNSQIHAQSSPLFLCKSNSKCGVFTEISLSMYGSGCNVKKSIEIQTHTCIKPKKLLYYFFV